MSIIEQTAGDVSEIDASRIDVFELAQAAAPTAVAQRFPFDLIEFSERFTLPERLNLIVHRCRISDAKLLLGENVL